MDTNLANIETDIANYNKVKELVLTKLVKEGYVSEEEAEEFCNRCQVMVYKGKWYEKWFKKAMPKQDENGYYMRIVEMAEKQTSLDDLIRRTANER